MSTQVTPARLDSTKDFSSLVPAAYAAANAAFVQANAAYAQANTGGGGAGSDAWARDTANASFLQANSAASFANGSFVTANSAASFANGAFLVANSGSTFANAAFVTSNSAAVFANAAFDRANAAYAQANTGGGGSGSDAWARAQANAAYEQANTASNTANSFTGNIAVNIDNFTGDGSTTNFTMSTAPTDANNVIINVNGVIQLKSAYTVTANSTTLTLSSAPANGAKVDAIIFKSGAVSSSGGGGTSRAQSMTMGILFGG